MPLLFVLGCHDTASTPGGDTGVPADTATPFHPPDIYVSALSGHAGSKEEWEPALANNGSENLVSSWTEWPGGSAPFPLGESFSTDGGASWSPPTDVASPDGSAADSVLASLGTGFVLAWYDHDGDAPHIYAATGDAASGFGVPVEVSDPARRADYDKPWLAELVDGSVLLTYQAVIGRKYAGVAARSTDGVTWTSATIVEDTTFRNLYFPCASDSGRVWLTYYVEGAIGLGYSDDDGATWTLDDAGLSTPANLSFAEPECVASGEDVWILYGNSTVDPDGDATGVNPRLDELWLAHVTGGDVTTLSVPLDRYALSPQLAIERDGAIDVTWYAGDAIGDPAGSYVRTRFVGDVQGEPVVWRTGVAFDPDRSSDGWIGDYGGIRALPDRSLAATVVETSEGYGHVSFALTTPGSGSE